MQCGQTSLALFLKVVRQTSFRTAAAGVGTIAMGLYRGREIQGATLNTAGAHGLCGQGAGWALETSGVKGFGTRLIGSLLKTGWVVTHPPGSPPHLALDVRCITVERERKLNQCSRQSPIDTMWIKINLTS